MRPSIHVCRIAIVAVTSVIGVASCDLGLWGPSGPGVIRVTLVSPDGADGAAVVELTGGVALGVVASEVGDTFYEHDGSSTRAVIVLDEPGYITFTVQTADVGARPDVEVVQVADGEDRLRSDLSRYEVELEQLEQLTSNRQRRRP